MEKAREICIEMLNQRGYTLVSSEEDKLFAERGEDRVIVIFISVAKFKNESIKECVKTMNTYGYKHGILIYENQITSAAKKTIETIHDIVFEKFSCDELQYNITKHELVPLFEKIDKVSDFKRVIGKIPIMLATDAISKFYFFKRGDIVKITRKNNYVTYRLVV
jgi:DNA-directed RNA polymerase subunit H (RpoH/RPB5)